jgi:NADH dehydrogenase
MITDATPEGLPGVAPVAMQQGKHLAKNLIRIINGQPAIPFKYFDKGTMATVGRNRAVADLGKLHFQGFFAWVMWMFVHLLSLAGFSNKLIVFFSWAINYLSKNSDNRLIVRNFNTESMAIENSTK